MIVLCCSGSNFKKMGKNVSLKQERHWKIMWPASQHESDAHTEGHTAGSAAEAPKTSKAPPLEEIKTPILVPKLLGNHMDSEGR